MLICRYFRTLANNRELLMLPSHGRGHEFKFRRSTLKTSLLQGNLSRIKEPKF